MKKYVWIVSKFISPYDDEREIVAVCSNKKIAQNCIKQFIKDDEGWGEFEQYLDNVEQMSDKELEDAMREEMSMYFFSNPNGLG